MHQRWAALVLVGTVIVGCGAGPGEGAGAVSVDGLRTDPDQRGLVASYVGGSCDGPARLAVQESADRIELSIVVEPDPSGSDTCDAAGHVRTVHARLRAAVGGRSVWAAQVRQLPFDGSRLLAPTALPVGFTAVLEQGSIPPAVTTSTLPSASGAAAAEAVVDTVDWTTFYSEPAVVDGNRCPPSRGTLEIALGPDTGIGADEGWTKGSTVDVDGHTARWWRQGGDRLALAWTTGGGPVAVITEVDCQGDRLLTTAEVERVARSLRPA